LGRHSRAGGNPARIKTREADKTAMLTRYAGYLIHWIPACAGMTGFEIIDYLDLTSPFRREE
jgi:hypothetical protein